MSGDDRMDHSTHTAVGSERESNVRRDESAKTGKRHLWLMVICCLMPVAALAAVWLFNAPVSGPVLIALVLLCPLSHLALMRLLMRESRDHSQSH